MFYYQARWSEKILMKKVKNHLRQIKTGTNIVNNIEKPFR